jgi:orotidine-5'-phosphate decarboxylase
MTAGATHIVVGRPIIEAADPGQAAKDILAEMS